MGEVRIGVRAAAPPPILSRHRHQGRHGDSAHGVAAAEAAAVWQGAKERSAMEFVRMFSEMKGACYAIRPFTGFGGFGGSV